MASTTLTPRAHPKRKRAEISYYESSDEDETTVKYPDSEEELSTRAKKKLKVASTNVSNRPLPKRKIFPFMSLPAEIKNQIYDLALTDASRIFLVSKTKRYRRTVQRSIPGQPHHLVGHRRHLWYDDNSSQSSDTSTKATLPFLVPNILLLNKAIYAETRPILYAGNSFVVDDTTAMHAFLAIIGPENRATITDLTIKGWGYTKAHKALNHPAFTMLASAVNLRRLNIDCDIGHGPKRVAKQLFRDGFHWLEAVGTSKGKFDAALDMLEIPEKWLSRDWYIPRMPDYTLVENLEECKAELRKLLSCEK